MESDVNEEFNTSEYKFCVCFLPKSVKTFNIFFFRFCRRYSMTSMITNLTRKLLPTLKNWPWNRTLATMRLSVWFGPPLCPSLNGIKKKNWSPIKHWNIWNNTLNCLWHLHPTIGLNCRWYWRCKNSVMKTWISWKLSRKSFYCFTKVSAYRNSRVTRRNFCKIIWMNINCIKLSTFVARIS